MVPWFGWPGAELCCFISEGRSAASNLCKAGVNQMDAHLPQGGKCLLLMAWESESMPLPPTPLSHRIGIMGFFDGGFDNISCLKNLVLHSCDSCICGLTNGLERILKMIKRAGVGAQYLEFTNPCVPD
uniref:Uncharacterized protein n=1 Tax=Sphaerodactylus townsendi TaxID=933632 RepID=A0ACB8EK83_9SAUR